MSGEHRVPLGFLIGVLACVAGCRVSTNAGGGGTGAEAAPPVTPVPAVASPEVRTEPADELWAVDDLILDRQRWTVGEQTGWAWRVRVPLPGHARVVPSETVAPLDEFVPDDTGPWAAINGGFYETGPMGLVVSDGEQRSALGERGGSGVFLFGDAGPRVIHRDEWRPGPSQALQSVDRIVDAGASLVQLRPEARRAARSAVAVGRTYLWLICVAAAESVVDVNDDTVRLQQTVGHGLTLAEFADYLLATTDTKEALNLDGSISVQMEARAGDRVFRIVGQAGTINAVVIRPRTPGP